MRLYFLRHADALPGADDDARPLSDKGRDQCRLIGRFLHRAGLAFDAAYSSHLVRAWRTGELVLAECGAVKPSALKRIDELGLGASQREFDTWLRCLPDLKHVLLVGHAPSLAAHVRRLLGLANADAFELPKAGLACVDTDNRRTGELKFFITPRVLSGGS